MRTKVYITRQGLEKLKKELDFLRTIKRKEIANRIRKALESGDVTENGEYAQAREDQAFNEGKIAELEEKIKRAEIINQKTGSLLGQKIVQIGSKILVKFDSLKAEFVITGSSEADPSRGKISNESPLGQAFLGHKKGDMVEVKTPAGLVKYKILKVM